MRALLFVALVACGSDDAPGTPELQVGGRMDIFTVTSMPAGIDCGSGAESCDVIYPEPADVTLSIANRHPESCYLWGATVTPAEAGTCMVSGTQGTCTLHVDRPVQVAIGSCYNP